VSVFLELGRTSEVAAPPGFVVFSLATIFTHARLATMEQVIASVDRINKATQAVKQDDSCNLSLMGRHGFCVVVKQTQESIARLWQELVSEPGLPSPDAQTGTRPHGCAPV
jgi:hypothetical protein